MKRGFSFPFIGDKGNMGSSIVEIIVAILNGCNRNINDKEHERLALFFDDIAGSVYKTRYHLHFKPKYFIEKKNYDQKLFDDYFELEDVVPYEDFFSTCWVEMQQKLYGKNFGEDDALKRYLYTVFYNTLEQMIYDLTPGLQTRVKQLKLILPEICKEVKDKEWRLKKDFRAEDLDEKTAHLDNSVPPTAQFLFHSDAVNIPLPEIKQPKEDSEYGPAIKVEDMRQYLVELFNAAGGVIRENQLIEFVKRQFSIHSSHSMKRQLYKNGEDERQDQIEKLPATEQILPSQAYVDIAKEILSGMNARQKHIFRLNVMNEVSQSDVAKTLNISNGTVSGELKNIQKQIGKFLNSKSMH